AIPRPLKIGIGGPVGSGKTALAETLCRRLRADVDMAVITNDIYTKEDAEFLVRRGALPAERVVGVETGGCPHTAIREDASANLAGCERAARCRRGDRPFACTIPRTGEGVETILMWIRHELLLDAAKA